MCKGSKTQTATATNAPDPQAYQLYSNLLNQAQQVASTPYQAYGGELVAPMNAQQQLGTSSINSALPMYNQAYGMYQGAAAPISTSQIQQYQDPYVQSVINATQAQFSNQNEEARQKLLGSAAAQGALGGNRVGVAEGELARQQGLAQNPVIADLYSKSYQTGLNTALSQQQAAMQGAAGINATAQGVLGGGGAQIGAGSLQQQTQQAQNEAAYNQWMTQQAYPYQQLQWLANLGTGVGSQMGGTSTSSQPGPSTTSQILGGVTAGLGFLGAMSDERVKENIEPVGKTNDGQTIYRYNYKGDPETHIGLIAQEVEQEHPEAVREGEDGLKRVDYDRATQDATEAPMGLAAGGTPFYAARPAATPWQTAGGVVPNAEFNMVRGNTVPKAPSAPSAGGSPKVGDLSGLRGLGKLFGSEGASTDGALGWANGIATPGASGSYFWGDTVVPVFGVPRAQGGAVEGPASSLSPDVLQSLYGTAAIPGFADGGKIYENDEPSPLDPPSGRERDLFIRGVLAEAGNQGPQGMQAVANVVRNRAVNGNFGGDTPTGVWTAPRQFEPFNTEDGRERMQEFDPNSPAYQAAGAAIDRAYTGDDPTRGADHFYGPKAQATLGRSAPDWDDGTGKDIGDHRFFKLGDRGAGSRLASGVSPGGALAYAGGAGREGGLSAIDELSAQQRRGSGEPPEEKPGFDWSRNSDLWPALIATGFGMMASRSPNVGVAIGEGGLAGLSAYSQMSNAKKKDALTREQAQLRAKQLQHSMDQASRPYRELTEYQRRALEQKAPSQSKILNDIQQRRAAAIALGKDPNDPRTMQYILEGKFGASGVDKSDHAPIRESDAAVEAADIAIQGLEKALELSPKAYYGPGAGARGYWGSASGKTGGLFGVDTEAAEATAALDKLVRENTLTQLKAVFGGSPSNAEREALAAVAGSINDSPKVREEAYRHAMNLARRRQQYHRDRAEQLRAGTYYQPRPKQGEAPSLATFLERAKQLPDNANVTDEQLTEFYNRKYGKR